MDLARARRMGSGFLKGRIQGSSSVKEFRMGSIQGHLDTHTLLKGFIKVSSSELKPLLKRFIQDSNFLNR